MSVCTHCNERKAAPDRAWCARCRALETVRLHQLHKRRGWAKRFVGHDCRTCRTHKTFVARLHAQWDKRDVWIWKRCPKGHAWQKHSENGRCDQCAEEISRRCLASLNN